MGHMGGYYFNVRYYGVEKWIGSTKIHKHVHDFSDNGDSRYERYFFVYLQDEDATDPIFDV